jgi:GxxExxY protein
MWMQHEVTTRTKLHEVDCGEAQRFQDEGARATARAVSREIISAAIEVHQRVGPGLLESVYRACLSHELSLRGIAHRQEVPFPLTYKGLRLEVGHRLDLLVEDLVVVELKSVECLDLVHEFQLLTYLRVSGRWMGLLINFNTDRIKHGLRRILNG